MKDSVKNYTLLLIGVFGFSLKSIFIKLAYLYQIDTVPLLVLRMLFSVPFYIAILIYLGISHKNKNPNGIFYYILLLLCSMGYYIASVTDMYSLEFISVGLERIVLFTFPIFALLLSIVILRKKFSYKVLIPFLICFIGIIITFVFGTTDNSDIHLLVIGSILALISAIAYALYFVLSEKAISKKSPIQFNCLLMLIACVFSIFQYLLEYSPSTIFVMDKQLYIIAVCMAIFSTVLPSFLIMYSIKKISASTTALFNNLGPFLTVYLGYIILGESVTIGELIGFTLVILGVLSLRRFK